MANVNNAKKIRDIVYALDPNDRYSYEHYRREFFEDSEGKDDRVYRDTNVRRLRTVGIGFNLDQSGAKKQWNAAFRNSDGTIAVDFDEVYSGRRALTDLEIDRLFDYSALIREKELTRSYGKAIWNKLRPNERLAIESIYFNKPKLVRGDSDIQDLLKKYVKTDDPVYLKQATEKILENLDGLGDRRPAEAEMLASYKCPLFTKEIILGETLIHRETPGPFIPHDDLYIWRTKGDERVRKTHQENANKLFLESSPPPTGNPGDGYNCRCYADHQIPVWVRIVGIKVKSEYDEAFLKVKCALEDVQFALQEHEEEENFRYKDGVGDYQTRIAPAIFRIVSWSERSG